VSTALGNDRAIDQALADGRGTHAPGGLSLWRPVILPVVAAHGRFPHLSLASRKLAPRELASCESVTCSVVSSLRLMSARVHAGEVLSLRSAGRWTELRL